MANFSANFPEAIHEMLENIKTKGISKKNFVLEAIKEKLGKKISILVVDDDDEWREIIIEQLKDEFLVTGEATSGSEAIRLYKQEHFSVVILDVLMPHMDGVETVKEILAYNPDAVIIILTALGQIEYALNFGKMGVTDYLVKPFQKDNLIKRIYEAIWNRYCKHQAAYKKLKTLIKESKELEEENKEKKD